jgi:hypothetical protein
MAILPKMIAQEIGASSIDQTVSKAGIQNLKLKLDSGEFTTPTSEMKELSNWHQTPIAALNKV